MLDENMTSSKAGPKENTKKISAKRKELLHLAKVMVENGQDLPCKNLDGYEVIRRNQFSKIRRV